MSSLFILSTNHSEAAQASMEWRQKKMGKVKCQGCTRIGEHWFPNPVDIVLDLHPGYKICCFVCFTSMRIFHIDFINQLHTYLSSFITGKCFCLMVN